MSNHFKKYYECSHLDGLTEQYGQVDNIFLYLKDKLKYVDNNNARIIHKESYLTYSDLIHYVDIISQSLEFMIDRKPNVSPIVGIQIKEGFQRIVIILACLKQGLTIVPFDVNLCIDKQEKLINLSHMDYVIYDELNSHFNNSIISISYQDLLTLKPIESKEDFIHKYSNFDTVILLFTSGSSGESKLVKLSHNQLNNRLNWHWRNLGPEFDEVVCHRTQFMFVDNIIETFSCILSATTMVIVSPIDACDIHHLSRVIYKHKITWLLCVPSLLERCLENIDNNDHETIDCLKSLKTLVSSGEILQQQLGISLMNLLPNIRLINLYGSTEVCGDVTFKIFNSIEDLGKCYSNGFLSVGTPVANNTVFIENSTTEEFGEIVVKGANLYLQNEYFHTGDIGFIKNQQLYAVGRNDDMIKVNGQKLFVNNINRDLLKFTFVKSCITLKFMYNLKNILVCFYTMKYKLKSQQILVQKQEISTNFPFRKYLGVIIIFKELNNIPYQQQSMKPDKQFLRNEAINIIKNQFESYLPKFSVQDQCSGINNKMELVHKIFAKHLKILPNFLKDHMNFHQLGGDSLTSVLCIADLNKCGLKCSIELFFNESQCSIGQLKEKIIKNHHKKSYFSNFPVNYKIEFLTEKNELEIVEFLVKYFFIKDNLMKYLNTDIREFKIVISEIFRSSLQSKCSFCIRCYESNSLLAVSLSDRVNPQNEAENVGVFDQFDPLRDFLNFCKLKEDKSNVELGLSVNVVGISTMLSSSNICHLVYLLEQNTINLARLHNYKYIETVNTSEVTTEICDEFNYRLMKTTRLSNFLNQFAPHLISSAKSDVLGNYMILDLEN